VLSAFAEKRRSAEEACQVLDEYTGAVSARSFKPFTIWMPIFRGWHRTLFLKSRYN
jgi:hypothetical protein